MNAALKYSDTWRESSLPDAVKALCAPGTRLFFGQTNNCKVLVSHEAKLGLTPDDVNMTMNLPPSSEFVNIHENCFHLYECRCHR
jgi:hypothetical protein